MPTFNRWNVVEGQDPGLSRVSYEPWSKLLVRRYYRKYVARLYIRSFDHGPYVFRAVAC